MRFKKSNEEILFTEEYITKIDNNDIFELIDRSKFTKRKKIRLCTHGSIEDTLHEMIIIHSKNTYVRPHKHINKIESFHIINGIADVIIFNDNEEIIDLIPMGNIGSNRYFYYRLSAPYFHTLLIYSDIFVFHEITNGPFRRNESVYASWAPEEKNRNAVDQYIKKLNSLVCKYMSKNI